MSINEPGGLEPSVTSPILELVHNPHQPSLVRSPALSEGQDSDAAEEGVIAPVRIGHLHRLELLRSPALSEGQDSDATEEGVIAPVRLGNLQRLAFARSPGLSDGQDSDATEDGLIAPVALGNQQRLPVEESQIFDERHESDTVVEGSAQINPDLDLRAGPVLMSNDPGNSSRPSVIFTGEGLLNLQADPNAGSSDTSLPVPVNVDSEEYTDGVILMTNPEFDHQDEEPMQGMVLQIDPPQAVSTAVVAIAGPSNRPDNITSITPVAVSSIDHSAQDENAIIPVVINNPTPNLRSDSSGPADEASHSPSQTLEGASREAAQVETGPSAEVVTASTSGPAFEDRLRDEGEPPCKRQKLSADDMPVAKKEAPVIDSDEDDGLTCTICLDQWTSSGEHRLVSLKCGHLFGFSCIERWIKNQKAAERKCPTCKSKAKMADVRNLYGNRIQMVDTTELEEFRGKNKELEREKEDLVREVGYLRMQNDELLVKHREALVEIQKLKTEKMQTQRPKRTSEVPHLRYRAQLVQTLELSKNEGCRVLAFNEARCIIAASLPSPTNLFKEYALKLIDAETFRPRQTMPSHSRMIRDVAFSNDGKLLLSCSLDKTANVLCMDSNTSIATFQSELPVWSVCWDADNPWVLFTGAQNGVVQQFDVRSPGQEVSRIVTEGNPTPVASLAGIPKNSGVGWPQGGLLSCRFRQLYPYERTSTNSFEVHPCSIDGAFTSLRYEKRTEHFLVSTRPTERSPRAQHMLFQMSTLGRVPQYNLVQNFFGSTTLGVISRSCIMPIMSPQGEVEDLLVSSYVESESHIGLWSCSVGQKLQSIQSSEIIMDLCPIFANGKNYLSSLSDKKLRLYKVEKS